MSEHKIPVVHITEILPHPNADRLEIIKISGFQCVVGKGQFSVGQLAVYIPPDSIVPDEAQYSFVWERDGGGNSRNLPPDEPVPEKYRRITVRRLRKEWSEGLLMGLDTLVDRDGTPISIFFPGLKMEKNVREGEDVAELLGITHYNPPEDDAESVLRTSQKQYRKFPRSLKGWYYFLCYWLTFTLYDPNGGLGGGNEKPPKNVPPIYDVENYKNHTNALIPGEQVVVTEKIHGSNARYVYEDYGVKIFLRGSVGHFYAGSRRLWKRVGGPSIWRKAAEVNPEIERWCRAHQNYTLYGEVTPTQKNFSYGATAERPEFFAFDILKPDGTWADYRSEFLPLLDSEEYDINTVPNLYEGPYDFDKIVRLADGETQTDGGHIREGIVIKTVPDRFVYNLGRCQVKVVSNAFLEADVKIAG